jgi:hypothetical protein
MDHLEKKNKVFDLIAYLITKIHTLFLVDFFQSIQKNILLYKVFISIYLSFILIIFNMITYHFLPSSKELHFFISTINAWFQLTRVTMLLFCNNNKDVFN